MVACTLICQPPSSDALWPGAYGLSRTPGARNVAPTVAAPRGLTLHAGEAPVHPPLQPESFQCAVGSAVTMTRLPARIRNVFRHDCVHATRPAPLTRTIPAPVTRSVKETRRGGAAAALPAASTPRRAVTP